MTVPTADSPLIVQLASNGASLLTRAASKSYGGSLYASILGQLVYVDEEGALRPGLASRWTPSGDFRDWTLELRPGRFHNGRPYTAQDLRHSLLRYFQADGLPVERQYLRLLRGSEKGFPADSAVEVVDDHTLTLRLTDPFPRFMYSLEESCFSPVPREELSDDNLNWKGLPVGAGPYKVLSSNGNGSRITLELTASGYENAPRQVVFCSSEDETPDVIVNPEDFDAPPGFIEYTGSGTAFVLGLFFNYKSLLGRCASFRKAVAASIDRAGLIPGTSHIRPTACFLADGASPFCDAGEGTDDCRVVQEHLRAASAEVGFNVAARTHRINIHRYKTPGPQPEWLRKLGTQLDGCGVRHEMYAGASPVFDPSDDSTLLRLVKFIPSNRDPVVLLQVFSEGGPSVPSLDAPDMEYESRLKNARSLHPGADRDKAIQELLERFSDQTYAIPLFSIRNRLFVSKLAGPDVSKACVGWGFYVERLSQS